MGIKYIYEDDAFIKITETNEKQRQKILLLKISLDYFAPSSYKYWFCYNIMFNFSEIPNKINYYLLKKYIENDEDPEKKILLNTITINNIACVSKKFLTNLNDDTVDYIKEFIRIDLTILYNVFKYYWLQSYFNLIKMEKDLLEKKRSTLKFNEKEYEYVNRAIKNIKRDERKLKKKVMFF